MFLKKDINIKITINIIPSIIYYLFLGFSKSYIKYLMTNKFITPYFGL